MDSWDSILFKIFLKIDIFLKYKKKLYKSCVDIILLFYYIVLYLMFDMLLMSIYVDTLYILIT